MDNYKEKLLQDAYQSFFNLLLEDFPLERMNELVVDDITGFGSTLDEKIPDISRFRKLVTDQREQGAGIDMIFKTDKLYRRISPGEDVALFTDEIEISMVIDGDKNLIPLRLSTVFEFIENSWKVVHIHGSKAVETERDTWHKDEWKRKNEELEALVAEKTTDLLHKNKELEIETALEKVRAIALSMKEPADMLDVCHIISEQLKALHIKNIRNIQTAIIYESKVTYTNYEYFNSDGKSVITEVEYNLHPEISAFAIQMLKAPDAFFNTSFDNVKLKEWKAYLKKAKMYVDAKTLKAKSLHYYFYSIGPGALGISTYDIPLNMDEMEVFKRFRNVFELAYRRFIDIELAIVQAKEARIETALERIRAMAMAMTKPDDLLGTCKVLYEELHALGFGELRNALINIHDDAKYLERYVYIHWSIKGVDNRFLHAI